MDADQLIKICEDGYTWYVTEDKKRNIVRVHTSVMRNSKKHTIYLHRLLLNAPDGMPVDHINHNELDNRLSNLRIVTSAQNSQNRRGPSRVSKTGVRNVYYQSGRWYVMFINQGKHYRCGSYKSLEEAKIVADELRPKYLPFAN